MSKTTNSNSRRQFLRNSAIASLTFGILPKVTQANPIAIPLESGSCNPITPDYYGLGPFYTADAPVMVENQLAEASEPGIRLILSGIIQTLDCSAAISNTLIDVWHANNNGAYDNVGFTLRGITYSNAAGFYMIETILPGKYLNGGTFRPSHIHFKITPPGFPTIVTQLYFEGDTDIPADAAASITSGPFDATNRIIPIALNGDGKYEGTWDIAIDGNGVVGIADLHTDKGIIYSVAPNPFTDKVVIKYGVFHTSKATIQVFDIQGIVIAILDEQQLQAEKYEAVWNPDANLPAGIYFIGLKLNDLQVHYMKIVKA